MTTATINPGVCGFTAQVEAVSEDGMTVKLSIKTDCPSYNKMFEELGDTFDAYELCFATPGDGPLYEYAREHFPKHGGCAVMSGIIKTIEVECKLALPTDTSLVIER